MWIIIIEFILCFVMLFQLVLIVIVKPSIILWKPAVGSRLAHLFLLEMCMIIRGSLCPIVYCIIYRIVYWIWLLGLQIIDGT